MTACTACQTVNPEGTRYCTNCGQALAVAPTLEVSNEPPAYSPPPTYAPPPSAPAYAARPTKDKSIALILEILPGLFGLLGFGWIYSGETGKGLIWLIGFLVWAVMGTIINIFTGGLACLCTLPIGIAAVSISTYFLNEHTKKHPELFG